MHSPHGSVLPALLRDAVSRLVVVRPHAGRDDLIVELLADSRWGCTTEQIDDVVACVDAVLRGSLRPRSGGPCTRRDPYSEAWNKAAAALAAKQSWDRLTLHGALDDREAEYFAAQFLKVCGGWLEATATRQSNDDGIDVVGTRAMEFGATAQAVAQVKWYQPGTAVSLDEVKAFLTSADGRFGVFITTAHFSTKAHELRHKRQNQLVLLEGSELAVHFGRTLGCV